MLPSEFFSAVFPATVTQNMAQIPDMTDFKQTALLLPSAFPRLGTDYEDILNLYGAPSTTEWRIDFTELEARNLTWPTQLEKVIIMFSTESAKRIFKIR